MQQENVGLIVPPVVKLSKLKNLFIQLNASCNLKCKYCYIKNDNKNDFIEVEKIKQALNSINKSDLSSIYLTGGEPLMHPDFNQILRMCLKVSNTTIMTNGIMINDKKARFLRKIDDETNFETIYRISLDSTDEAENDMQRGRGSFRHAISAIFSLIKYEFNPIISVVNWKNRSREEIFDSFQKYFSLKNFELESINLKVIPYFSNEFENKQIEKFEKNNIENLDCATSRTISTDGIWACPMLSGDYRARMGTSMNDYSSLNYLDCEKCMVCVKNGKAMVNDWC